MNSETLRLRTSGEGYEYVQEERGAKPVYIHRLAAVAKYGFDAVRDMDVHHDNHVQWDNSLSNLVPEDPYTHRVGHLMDANEKRRAAKAAETAALAD